MTKPTILPYRRGNIYTNVCVRGGDDFLLLAPTIGHGTEAYFHFAESVGVYEQVAAAWESEKAHAAASGSPMWKSPETVFSYFDMMRMYLYANAQSSFAINNGWGLLVGFRSEKDAFKFSMKFPSEKRRVWDSSTPFFVFIDENDPKPFTPVLVGNWNANDPKTGWI